MKTDLHIHTNCSDGSLSPEQIVERACGAGLDAIAVTDHDNANGVEACGAEYLCFLRRA